VNDKEQTDGYLRSIVHEPRDAAAET